MSVTWRRPEDGTRSVDIRVLSPDSEMPQAKPRVDAEKERATAAGRFRAEGNRLMGEENVAGAQAAYLEAVKLFHEGGVSWDDYGTVLVPVLNNLALCALRLKSWHDAAEYATAVLIHDPENAKAPPFHPLFPTPFTLCAVQALFRRFQARRELLRAAGASATQQQWDDADVDIQRAAASGAAEVLAARAEFLTAARAARAGSKG